MNNESVECDIHVESKNLQEQLESLIVNQNNLSESDGDDDYNTTQTSLNSDDCIEYDSDLSSTNSVLFYSDSDDFIDNEFVRINHKPFMMLLKNNTCKLNQIFNLPTGKINLKNMDSFTNTHPEANKQQEATEQQEANEQPDTQQEANEQPDAQQEANEQPDTQQEANEQEEANEQHDTQLEVNNDSDEFMQHINMSTYIKQVDSTLFDDMNKLNLRYKDVYKKLEEHINSS